MNFLKTPCNATATVVGINARAGMGEQASIREEFRLRGAPLSVHILFN